MKFGIFDHVDLTGQPLHSFYEDRLKLVEAYDRSGFHCYHVAEHHFTPLGLAASPSVYLAAVSQRTRRIKFGPCVYLLGLYHPLRLIEEVCMLDNLSGGRFQLGFGRGVSPFEMGYYGVDMKNATAAYLESYQILMKGLTEESLTFHGSHYRFDKVPMVLKPLQAPHPPLWYGLGTPDAAEFCAASGINTLSIGTAAKVRPLTDRYRQAWQEQGKPLEQLPLLGLSRHVVVAETDRQAQAIAQRAYPHWRENLAYLWHLHDAPIAKLEETYPPDWKSAEKLGMVVAGSPDTVREYVADHTEAAGVNYFCGWFAFGDMSGPEAMHSSELFASEVMPGWRRAVAVA